MTLHMSCWYKQHHQSFTLCYLNKLLSIKHLIQNLLFRSKVIFLNVIGKSDNDIVNLIIPNLKNNLIFSTWILTAMVLSHQIIKWLWSSPKKT